MEKPLCPFKNCSSHVRDDYVKSAEWDYCEEHYLHICNVLKHPPMGAITIRYGEIKVKLPDFIFLMVRWTLVVRLKYRFRHILPKELRWI